MSLPASGNELTSRGSMSVMSETSAFRPSPGVIRTGAATVARAVSAAVGAWSLVAEVEAAQPRHPLRLAPGDLVERVLHLRGELVVDELAEVPLEQRDHREREEGGHQRGALLEHVAAVEDRPDDARVGRRAADLAVFELLDQRRLGVPGRRPGGVLGGREAQRGQRVAPRPAPAGGAPGRPGRPPGRRWTPRRP